MTGTVTLVGPRIVLSKVWVVTGECPAVEKDVKTVIYLNNVCTVLINLV